jgi:hypothetical protein
VCVCCVLVCWRSYSYRHAVFVSILRSLCIETEEIGNGTLRQMGRQREQLQGANSNIDAIQNVAQQARIILTDLYV